MCFSQALSAAATLRRAAESSEAIEEQAEKESQRMWKSKRSAAHSLSELKVMHDSEQHLVGEQSTAENVISVAAGDARKAAEEIREGVGEASGEAAAQLGESKGHTTCVCYSSSRHTCCAQMLLQLLTKCSHRKKVSKQSQPI